MPLDFPSLPAPGTVWTGSNGCNYVWDGQKWTLQPDSGGPFLPLSGGTVGSTPYGQTTFTFNPVNPRNGSGALMLNKVSGSALGDDPQIVSYFHQDHNGGANPSHMQIVSSASSNSGMWSLMNQSYFSGNDSGATNGHVGFYSQQVRTGVNAGGARGISGWCSVMELRSQTGLPSSQDGILQTLELDLFANGVDDHPLSSGFGRTIITCVIGRGVPGGAACEVSNGITFFTFAGETGNSIKNVILNAAPFSVAVLNTTQSAQLSGANAIWLADGHRVSWNTAGTEWTWWNGTKLEFNSDVVVDGGLQVNGILYTPANLTVGGLAALSGGGTFTGAFTINGTWKFGGTVGFNNTNPIAKPTITGSKGGNAALASLITALASYGLVTDSST